MAEVTYYWGTGRRKTATARVRLKPSGSGAVKVNRLSLDEYFDTPTMKMIVMQAFQATGTEGVFDLYANVKGGGKSGQAEAIRHGVARALLQFNPELRTVLRQSELLTRDARMKERKKYGQKGARAKFQFSKR